MDEERLPEFLDLGDMFNYRITLSYCCTPSEKCVRIEIHVSFMCTLVLKVTGISVRRTSCPVGYVLNETRLA